MKVSYVLQLKGDFYSLNYFSFFLDSDDEDLSDMANYVEIKQKLKKPKTQIGDEDEQQSLTKSAIDRNWTKEVRRKFRHQRNLLIFFKLLFIFVIQIFLLFALVWAIDIVSYFNGTHSTDTSLSEDDFPYVNLITKFMAALILHVTMQPKVEEAIQRLIYLRSHPHKFQNINIVILISYMKLTVEFATELICLMLTSTYPNSIEVVMNYIALAVISELDEVYYNSIKSPLKD